MRALAAILGREVGHIHNAAANTVEWANGEWHVLTVNGEPVDSIADELDEVATVVGDQG